MVRTLRSGLAGIRRRLVDLLGPTGDATRQSLTALGFNSSTSFAAGICLAGMLGVFQAHPALLVMVPPAVGLRGNVFGTFGNRVSTAIHMGTFETSLRPSTVLGRNTVAAMVLSLVMSFVLALLAQGAAIVFDLGTSMALGQLIFISTVGGLLASVIVLIATALLTALAVRRDWDLDNLVAPSVSTLGDVVTVPALWLAAQALRWPAAPVKAAGWALGFASLVALVVALRPSDKALRNLIGEALPVLCVAAMLSGLGGIVISKRLVQLDSFPALLILVPAFVSSVGALGGILSSRLSTNLHLGVVEPDVVPGSRVVGDVQLIGLLAVPIMVFNAVGAHYLGMALGQRSPGLGPMVLATLLAAVLAVLFVVMLAYYGTIAAWRFEVDPDAYGIPTVTAAVDFVGAAALILALVTIGAI